MLIFLMLLACVPRPGRAQEPGMLEDMNWQPEVATNPPDAVDLWFPIGERLTYTVHWGMFQVAQAVVSTDWVRWRDGRLLVRLRYKTQSNKVIEKIYPVNSQIDSFVDPVTFQPIRFVKNTNEGKRKELSVTDFNHPEGTARWRKIVRKYEDWLMPIPPGVRDIPSFSYWIRKEGFSGGSTNTYLIMADDKLYELLIFAEDRNETFQVPGFGLVPSLRLTPEASFEGLFARQGKLSLAVSKGAPCLMLYMDAEVPVAKVRLKLAKIEGPRRNDWADIWPSVRK